MLGPLGGGAVKGAHTLHNGSTHLVLLNIKPTWHQGGFHDIIGIRHVFDKGPECPVLASYQMWLCQKLLKIAKLNNKIVKIWQFF